MYLLWRITDDITNLSVDEFDRNYNGIYGYMRLQINNYSIGYLLDEATSLEGNTEILYYINYLIQCGISIKKGETIEINLLNYNLLKIIVSYSDGVDIKVIDVYGNEQKEFFITFEELIAEIKHNYKKLYEYIEEHNRLLLKAKMVRDIVYLYDEFTRLLASE